MSFAESLEAGGPVVPTIGGVPDQAVPFALRELCKQTHLHLVANDQRAGELVDTLPFFIPDAELIYFPAWDVLPYDRTSPNPAIVTERLEALMQMLKPASQPRIIVTTIAALTQLLPPKDELKNHMWALEWGESLDREALSLWLVQHGYLANSKAVESGEFAMRGSIIDIIPAGSESGFRLDLFGDDIESIKRFDPLTQLSAEEVEQVSLLPASEVLLTEQHIARFRNGYRENFGAISKQNAFYEAVSAGQRWPGMEHWLPLFYDQLDSLAGYVGDADLTMDNNVLHELDERKLMVEEAFESRLEADNIKAMGVDPYHPLSPKHLYSISDKEYFSGYQSVMQFSAFTSHGLDTRSVVSKPFESSTATRRDRKVQGTSHGRAVGETEGINNKGAFNYKTPHLNFTEGDAKAKNPFAKLKALIDSEPYQQKKMLLTCFSVGSRERLVEMLHHHDITAERVESYQQLEALGAGRLAIAAVPMSSGIESDDALVLSEQQLLGERLIRTKRKKKSAELFMAEAATFQEGELVVHKEHGIGRFDALETISAGGAAHDCLKLVYADDDRLFVPVENMDVLTRHGSDSDGVELDRLGASQWQARKAKMKERIGIIAEALMKTAAERMLKPGEVLQAEQHGYTEFSARFGHVETEDQERAIEEVTQDLLSGKPMDRLICGDVGFGKTEVALRAAYVATSSGITAGENSMSEPEPSAGEATPHEASSKRAPEANKKFQVALIVPTTLLARQHFQNFSARFAGFGLNVRQLSRMVSTKEMVTTKAGLKDGSVDIVVGTHALLAKDIEFHNLGLVIVDEEQRFGVTQKEKLKALKSDVHVLTLTATPIPRTLQLSLAGVRDLSLITTPPVDRLAVRTFVMPFDPVALREALMREKNRGGGSFIVTPRIADIGELKARIRELIPDLTIEVAHGQMPSNELDELMNRFYDRKIDVLISTTIIESGLDVSHANTMIINKADRFGLAQLYQLRGRVGRSKTRAYAYLLLPQGKVLTKQATKRLEVMQTLDRLGAGFTLASHDMDIRGFGNLVGDEQSGHIREVGVELYQQMLNDEIEKLRKQNTGKGKQREVSKSNKENGQSQRSTSCESKETFTEADTEISPQINLGISVLIPEHYVEDLSLRMGLYRRISSADSEAELESLAAEMIDRFGSLPEEVSSLFTVMRFKRLCKQLRITKLDAGPKGLVIHMAALSEKRAESLLAFLSKHPTTMKLRPDQSIFVSESYKDEADKLAKIRQFLEKMIIIL